MRFDRTKFSAGTTAEVAYKQGVNDGIRLAAQLIRDHVLGEVDSVLVADFLVRRAERAALRESGGAS